MQRFPKIEKVRLVQVTEKIRTYNFPQSRVTDHRIGLTLYKLDDILNGNIDEIIDALIAYDRAEKLKESMENK